MIADSCNVTVDWLLTGHEQEIALAARKSAGSSVAVPLELANEYATKRKDLAEQGRVQSWSLPGPIAMQGRWVDQGARLAEAALQQVRQQGREPWEPLFEVIPQVFGIDVAVQDLGEGFDGLAVATETARLILVNRTSVYARQRFTIAHELGHLLASDDQQIHQDKDIHADESRTGESEMRANAFAAAFLMPEVEVVREPLRTKEAFCALACQLHVSPSALAYRLKGLRAIDGGTCDDWRGISASQAAKLAGCEADVPLLQQEALTLRAPESLVRDTYAAYRAGEITLRPYAQLLGVETATLRQQLSMDEGV